MIANKNKIQNENKADLRTNPNVKEQDSSEGRIHFTVWTLHAGKS